MLKENNIYLGDCLELMKEIPDKSIDMILCDLPYGTTACKWDIIIPFNKYIVEKIGNKEKYVYQEEYVSKRFKEGIYNYPKIIEEFNNLAKDGLWEQYKRIIKDNGAIVLTASQPFTSALVMSNPKMYRHNWVWNKNNSAGFATAKIRPFAICEDILIFGKNKVNYNPIMEERGKPRTKGGYSSSDNYGLKPIKSKSNVYYPKNLINISNANQNGKTHPTQKPVALFEYLIKTYTNEGDVILDNCAGSGTTAIACINTNRNYILMEQEQKYFDIINKRIESHVKKVG